MVGKCYCDSKGTNKTIREGKQQHRRYFITTHENIAEILKPQCIKTELTTSPISQGGGAVVLRIGC